MMLSTNFDNIPDELKKYPQWVNWRLVPRKDGEKLTKPPYQPNGKLAKTDGPQTWSGIDAVQKAVDKFAGVGFVLTPDDEFVALDLDHCRCPVFDGVTPWANSLDTVLPEIAEHIRRLNSYTEKSPSGKGVRIILKGKLPVDGKRKGPVEVYQSGRYVTVTGHVLEGFPLTIENRQDELNAFFQDIFGRSEKSTEQDCNTHREKSTVDWKERLGKAFGSKNGEEIKKLYYGDYSTYQSQSEADMALCSHLAFWFNGDTSAIDSAFRESGLMRKKWNEKHLSDGQTYGEATISKTIEGCKSFFGTGDTLNARSNVSGKIDHLQVAKDVVANFRQEDLAFVSGLRIFRKWNGQVWGEIDDRSINKVIVEYLGDKTHGVTKNVIESIIDLIRTNVFRQEVTWDTDTGVIPVKNGELK